MRKKLLPLIMAAIMLIMGLGVMDTTEVAAANTGTSVVEITKTLTATGLEDTTFYFTVANGGYTDTPSSVTSQPDIDNFEITVKEGEKTGTYNIELPEYEGVGIYTYIISETDSKVAGVTYSTADLYLVVKVTNDGNGGFSRSATLHVNSATGAKNETEYENDYNAGTLSVTKSVTGDLGDKTKEFDVTVTFTKDSNVTVNSTISYEVDGVTYTIDPSVWSSSNTYKVTFKVKDGTTVTFNNIPYGIAYDVDEADYSTSDGYTTTYSGTDRTTDGSGTLDTAEETVTITNNKESDVDTGVILDSLPYILILAVVVLGVVCLVIRRRSSNID